MSESDDYSDEYDQAGEAEPPLDEWDDDCEAVDKKGITWYQASFNLVIVVIGAGVMALPMLPHKGGYLPSFVALFFCGACITESGMAMWRGFMAGNKGAEKDAPPICSYEDFGRAAYGMAGEVSVMVMLIFYFIGVIAGFLVLICDSVVHIARSADWFSSQQWMLALSPVWIFLALLPNVSVVSKFSFIAVIAVFILCGIIIVKSAMDSQRYQVWPDLDRHALYKSRPDSFLDMGSVIATFFGAFGVNGNVPAVLSEMEEPKDFRYAFLVSMFSVTTIYVLVMGCGYYGYGEFMQREIVDSLVSFPANQYEAFHVPYDDWTGPKAGHALEDLLSGLLFVKLIIALPLNMMVIFQSFQTFSKTRDIFPLWSIPNIALRVGVVVLSVGIAELIPDFSNLFSLVCSIFGPCLQCIFPLLFSYKIRKMGNYMHGKRTNLAHRFFHLIIILLAIFTITIGFYDSLLNVIEPEPAVEGGDVIANATKLENTYQKLFSPTFAKLNG